MYVCMYMHEYGVSFIDCIGKVKKNENIFWPNTSEQMSKREFMGTDLGASISIRVVFF